MFPFFLKYLANVEYIISSGLFASEFTLMMQIHFLHAELSLMKDVE